MNGGFKVNEMWNDPDDRFRKFDAIAVIVNRLKVIVFVLNIILLIVGIIIGVILIASKAV